jgi:hypothetical protein
MFSAWRWRSWTTAAALLAAVYGTTSADAQTASVTAVKAAFLYNFAKFTEWPIDALSPGQRLSLCVVGDANVADALEQTIRGHVIDGHELTVQVVKADTPTAPTCRLLYLGAADLKRSSWLLAAFRTSPVLTVSDGDDFAKNGGIVQLISENDRIRFAINVTAAERAGLRLSSRLLGLATIVKDDLDVKR